VALGSLHAAPYGKGVGLRGAQLEGVRAQLESEKAELEREGAKLRGALAASKVHVPPCWRGRWGWGGGAALSASSTEPST